VCHLYQVAGLEAANDLLTWTAVAEGTPARTAAFFTAWAEALAPLRRLVEIREALWGFTRPSQYTRTRSTQEIDPFAPARAPWLIVYPFVKTAEWYQADRDERQRLMGEHIKVGRQYEDISQLLLYSTGLQDQEFVVVYETADPLRFLALVQELRSTAARPYTLRDAPLHTGLHQPGDTELARWL
jgi:chlorite dismutase